ncbi:MAG TPA: T9SS type A sorting domain-containing protein [Bacteroidales bacterium]|nr:T9SS type A sorting domain-containing protein [Bacteroidales bacterium]
MKKAVYLFICLAASMLFSFPALAQVSHQFDWVKQNLPDDLSIYSSYGITADYAGNIITTGYYSYSVDFDPGPGTSYLTTTNPDDRDMFLQKLDPDGNLLWALRFGTNTGDFNIDVGRSVCTDNSGNIYVAGNFNGTTSFGGFFLTAQNGRDDFIMKLSPEGNVLWAKALASPDFDGGSACVVKVGSDGYVYATGEFAGTIDADPGPGELLLNSNGSTKDMYILRLDADGNYIWSGIIDGNSGMECRQMAVNTTGTDWEIYLGGGFNGTADFDPGAGVNNLTEVAHQDAFLMKIANGQFAWATKSGGNGVDEVNGLCFHADGYLYAGKFFGLYYEKTSTEIQKINPANGNPVWTDLLVSPKTTDNVIGGRLSLDAAGNLYVKVNYRGNIDFDPGAGKYILSNPVTFDGNTVILKLNNSGAFQWVMEFKTTCCSGTADICIDPSENIFLFGGQSVPIDFDPGSGTCYIDRSKMFAGFIGKIRKTDLTVCQPPVILQALNVEHNSASITWINIQGSTGCDLQYRLFGNTGWTTLSGITPGLVLSGLTAGSSYEYRLRSNCGGVPGEWSPVCWFKTIADGCSNPGEPNNILATATAINTGTVISGVIGAYGDTDWYKFNTTSTQKKINLTLFNLPSSYKMQLVKASGTVLATSSTLEDGTESIIYTKGVTGTYYIKVYGLENHFNQTECYSLQANIYKSTEADPIEETAEESILKLYPNPASNLLNVEFNSTTEGTVTMRLLDMTGRLLKLAETKVAEGENTFTLNLENLPDGMYLFVIVQGEYREMKKIIVNR